ncbi:hypothetical protein Hanom_Chr03g00267001 [Helianthus anomalus]
MESSIMNFLKFELTTPPVRCFLRRFVCVAHVVRYKNKIFMLLIGYFYEV